MKLFSGSNHFSWCKEDREYLVGGHWLSDSHLNAASQLLKKKHPQQNGLESTQLLVKKLQWSRKMWILFRGGNLWVCASNISSAPGVSNIYDSIPSFHSPILTRQVTAIMKRCKPSFQMRHINVPMQAGASDCGLFAIAFATALCVGKDPHKCSFNQESNEKPHKAVLGKGRTYWTPETKKPRCCTNSVKCINSVEVYCIYQLPWFKVADLYGHLVQCGSCKE